jgi:hypothetical protein
MWIFFPQMCQLCALKHPSLSPESRFIKKKKSERQNLGCFLLDLKAMYRIPIWQGNLLAANVTHAYRYGCGLSVFVTRCTEEVFEIFNSCATSLMLSVPSSKASKISLFVFNSAYSILSQNSLGRY